MKITVKRYGNLWEQVCSLENITKAYLESRKGKTTKPQVAKVDEDPMPYLEAVRRMLVNKTYRSGEYRAFSIHERRKDRVVYDIDYFPHRIVHWALMIVIKPILMDSIGDHSFAAMEGRGSHQALRKVQEYLRRDPDGTKYCFKMDVRKFFPSIKKDIMLRKIERKIKDEDVLWLCREIIFGFKDPGLPIGNYTSQYFANYYLSSVIRHMKQVFHCHYLIAYMDDIVILGSSKSWLRRVKKRMVLQLEENGLEMKRNWQIFPVDVRGVDFVGYRIFRNFTLLRNGTKRTMVRKMRDIGRRMDDGHVFDEHDRGVVASYSGILSWCDGHRLFRKYIKPILRKKEAQTWMSTWHHRTGVPSAS